MNEQTISIFFSYHAVLPPPPPPNPFVYKIRRKTQVGYIQKNRVGAGGTLPEFLTLFQTKICDFPYSISHLIKNLIPYFRPEALAPGA